MIIKAFTLMTHWQNIKKLSSQQESCCGRFNLWGSKTASGISDSVRLRDAEWRRVEFIETG